MGQAWYTPLQQFATIFAVEVGTFLKARSATQCEGLALHFFHLRRLSLPLELLHTGCKTILLYFPECVLLHDADVGLHFNVVDVCTIECLLDNI